MKIIFTTLAAVLLPLAPMFAQNADDAAFTPKNPPQMQRLTNFDSPAWQAAKLFQRGVNLGNYLEVPPGLNAGGNISANTNVGNFLEKPPGKNWDVTVSAREFTIMHAQGFDHVRVPIGWQHYAGPAPDFTLSPEIFSRVDFVVTNALAAGLAVMINIHHFSELDKDPVATTDEFLKIWQQIAAHYKNFPPQLAFELDNEPHANATTAVMNPIYARAIAEIRETNPHRTIFVEPGGWGNIAGLNDLVLPPDDNVIVSAHCYDPFYFTHQGATWAGPDTKVTGFQFPGPPQNPLIPNPKLHLNPWVLDWIKKYNTLPADKNPCGARAFEGKLKFCRAWSDYYGRPIQIGEFGCFTTADPVSRANFYSAFRRAAEKEKIGWCIWDWSAGFRYWDKEKKAPMPGMRAALFGQQP